MADSPQSLSDLALFGAPPAFAEPLHVGRPNIGNTDVLLERIRDVLETRMLTNNGPYVRRFESAIAEMLGVRNCVAMCNATIALEIAIRALGLRGEVIVPSFTFVATPHSLQWQEITPVFCDIEPDTHTIDPARVESLITPRTTGIIGVHLWGRPCRITELQEIADRRKLQLMFDAAHAFGCGYQGKMLGGFGRAEVLSFHATKFLNAFEGGAVVTNDDDLARRIRLMKNFGFSGYDNVIYIGTNGKMTEVSAAAGLTNLESFGDFVAHNKRNYEAYAAGFEGIPGVRLLPYALHGLWNYQYIVIEVNGTQASLGRDTLHRVLQAEQILARRYFYPGCHRMEPYRSYFPHAGMLLPTTEAVAGRVLVLPTGTAVNPETVGTICRLLRFCLAHGQEIERRYAKTS
jgi:dTDP-4-amino-4,6-dideoxygalactose transaminase